MKRIILNFSVLFLSIALLNSCFFKDPGTEIKFGGLLIEIEKATSPGDANTKDIRQYEQVVDGRFTRDSLKINLVGAHQNEDIVVNFEVAPTADGSGTTAVAGIHYRIPSQQITIPAGKSFGYLYFEINDDILPVDPAQFLGIRFNLTSTSKGLLSENYKTHRVVVGGKCTFTISKFLGAYDCDEPGYAVYDVNFTSGTSTNEIVNDNFWDAGASITYTLNPAAGSVSISPQNFFYGPTELRVVSTGSPSIDPCTGRMVVPYRVTRVSNGAIVEENTHTFTRKP